MKLKRRKADLFPRTRRKRPTTGEAKTLKENTITSRKLKDARGCRRSNEAPPHQKSKKWAKGEVQEAKKERVRICPGTNGRMRNRYLTKSPRVKMETKKRRMADCGRNV